MKPFTIIAIAVFVLVSLFHLLRYFLGWEIIFNAVVIPMWASLLGLVIAGGLAFMLWREQSQVKSNSQGVSISCCINWLIGKLQLNNTDGSIDHVKFKNFWSGVQSIFLIIAIILGGVWTIISLDLFGEIRKAKYEIKELERNLQETAVVDINIEAKQVDILGEELKFISAVVNIHNKGTRHAKILFERQGPFRVTQFEVDDTGKRQMKWSTSSSVPSAVNPMNKISAGAIIRVGSTKQIPFLVKVPEPGFYYLSFHTEVDPSAAVTAKKAGAPNKPIYWGARSYLIIH